MDVCCGLRWESEFVAATKLLAELKAVDPVVYTAIGFVTILVALLASYVPSRRAVRIDPLRALRQE